uniref:Uncharacterized protein n=1 Tax=Rhizophora mucronata TaxID=61149 RepID=A0A2P2NBZ7_RHIMU
MRGQAKIKRRNHLVRRSFPHLPCKNLVCKIQL